MSLPPRAFFSIQELSARWSCSIADIAEWSTIGHLSLLTSIASVICDDRPVAGMVVVNAGDMMQMFRRHAQSVDACRVFRVKPQGETDWCYISAPAEGVLVRLEDVMLSAEEARQFEEERDLLRRPAVSPGAASRYDWEAVYIMLIRRINDMGLPVTQAELISEVQDWFAQNSPNGEIPEESTTRKKIAPIWRTLRGAG